MSAQKRSGKPADIRQQLSRWEEGAHLYATFGVHFRAGIASLIPFAILYFTTQPFGAALSSIATGGYTIAPFIVGVFATGWAAMSYGLLHLLRREERVWLHYLVYGLAGAAALLLVMIAIVVVVELAVDGTPNPAANGGFARLVWATPIVGAVGSLVGRWTLRSGIQWHIWIQRKPLPPVFDFVDRKHDKDDFERM